MLVGATAGLLTLYGARKRDAVGKLLGTVGLGLLGSELAVTGFGRLSRMSNKEHEARNSLPSSIRSHVDQERIEIAGQHEEWK